MTQTAPADAYPMPEQGPGSTVGLPSESGARPPRGEDVLDVSVCPSCLGPRHCGLTCTGLTSNQMYRVLRAIAARHV